MTRFRWTIKRKMLSLGTGGFLLAMAVLAFATWSAIKERSRIELDRASDEVATRIEGTIELVRSTLLTVARVQGVRDLDRKAMEPLIAGLLNTLPFLEGAGVFTADGQFLSTARAPRPGEEATPEHPQTVADRPWFQQLMRSGKPVVSGLLVGRVTGQPIVLVAVPVRKGDNRPHGGVAASVNLSRWFGFLRGLSLPPDLRLIVVDADGIVLAQNQSARQMVGQPVGLAFTRPGLVEWDGQRYLLETGVVRGVGWRVLAMLPRGGLYARAWEEVRVVALPMLGILVVAAIVGLLIASRVWRPLQTLTDGVREFGEGGPLPVPVNSTDEVGELALAFNEMGERIRRSQAALERRAKRLTALNASAATVSGSLKLEEVLSEALDTALRVMEMDGGTIRLLNEASGELEAIISKGIVTAEQLEMTRRIKLGQGFSGYVAATKRPFFVPDTNHEPRTAEFVRMFGPGSAVSLPLMVQDRVVGTMSLCSRRPNDFDKEDSETLTAIGQQVGLAVETARLYGAIERQAARLQGLYEVGKAISSTLELPEVLKRIAERAAEVIGSEKCAVWELNELDQRLYLRATKGIALDLFPVLGMGQGTVGTAAATRQPVFTPDYLVQPPPGLEEIAAEQGVPYKELVQRWGFRSTLAAPIIAREQVLGVINILWDEPHSFKREEVEALTAFASQAALAIANARLYAESVRDQTTLEDSHRNLEAIHHLSVAIQESVTLRERLDQILLGTQKLVGAERIGIWLPDADGSQLTIAAALDSLGSVGEISVPTTVEGGALAKAFREGREIWATPGEELSPELRLGSPYSDMRFLRSRSFGLLPLKARGKVIGVMVINNRGVVQPVSAESLPLLRIFAQQAAVAIENARLVENLQATLEELTVAQEQLVRVETLRSLGEMAAGAAHHMNNLLAVVVARVQLLLRATEDPKVCHALQIVERAALDGAEVVRRIQEFARARPRQDATPVDLNRIAEEVLEFTRPRWQNEALARGFQIEARLVPGVIPAISGHASELREMLTNLVLNAVDALPRGGEIVLRSWTENGWVLLSVADTGVGMSRETKRHAFEPFFTTKGVKSTGLGLSVVYGIVQRHGGTMDLESAEGRGTTVALRFPAMRPATEQRALPVEPPARAARLLVIDDEPMVLEAVSELVGSLGHSVAAASCGPEGLAMLERERYDLVLTDLAMPGMTGWQVAQAIKSRWPGLPVILLTGWLEQVDLADASRVDRVLRKPFHLREIQEVLAALLPAAS